LNIWKKITILAIMVLTLLVPTAVMAESASTSLSTDVVATVGLSVTPTDFFFGVVTVGTDSGVTTFTVTNTGTVPITVTASIPTDPTGFYTNCLLLAPSGGIYSKVSAFNYWDYSSVAIPIGGSITIYAKVHPDSMGYVATGILGSLLFTATPAP
jgi:hypothetical protein